MRPLGFHPGQRLAHVLGGTQPACPVECGHVVVAIEDRTAGAPLMQSRQRNEAAQSGVHVDDRREFGGGLAAEGQR